MSVHIGRLTSEISSTRGGSGSSSDDGEESTPWEQQRRIAATADRQRCLQMRTATGFGDD